MKASALLFSATLIALAPTTRGTVTETFKQTYPLAPEGIIHLENVNGDITIKAWDRSEVALEAEKQAKNDEELQQIKLLISSSNWNVNGRSTSKLTIKTQFPKAHLGFLSFGHGSSTGSVRYRLMVPAGARLDKIDSVNSDITVAGVRGSVELETVNGRITATGLAADARLESVNGSLSAEFASLDGVQKVKLDSVNGRASVVLPKGAGARIDADSVNGGVSIDQAVTLGKIHRHSLTGQIGSGGPDISLETVNGGISIKEK